MLKKWIQPAGLAAMILFMVVFIGMSEQNILAAEASVSGKLKNDGTQISVGGYYYTESYSQGLYISTAAGERGKLVLPGKTSGMSFNSDVYITGRYLYYSYSKGSSHKIYRMNLNGTGKKLIISFSNKRSYGGSIDFVYKNEYLLYSCTGDGSDAYNYSISLKKKKAKYLKGYNADFKASGMQSGITDKYHYKNYYVAGVWSGDAWYGSVWVYNAKKQTFKRISKKAWDIALAGKYVYYIENSGSTSCKLIRCTVNGKSKKTLCSIQGQNIRFYEVSDSNCIYWKSGSYYKYDFSAKTTTKVNL